MGALQKIWADESGATLVEYGVMLFLVAAVCFIAVASFGQSVSGLFSSANQPL
jgi:Flp pilus assembly pilin Flp